MRKDDICFWVGLNHVPGIGPVTFRRLIEHFGSAEKVWHAKRQDFPEENGLHKIYEAIALAKETLDPIQKFQQITETGIAVITIADTMYPRLLREIYDPPFVLYILGNLQPEDEKAIAVVGSRKMTSYGKTVTEKLSAELSLEGFTVVSGLARGVDSAAHQAALDAGGRTIAVLGGGLWHIYPTEHARLAERIAQGRGAVISEFPPDFPAIPGNFPSRNRIISGLSLGVVVTEAAEKSGTMITVTQALEQNREVFSVPGPITSALSVGTMRLIRDGAKLVTNVGDILEELQFEGLQQKHTNPNREIGPMTSEESTLLSLMENEPQHIDILVRESQLPAAKVLSTLATMEILGKVQTIDQGVWAIKV